MRIPLIEFFRFCSRHTALLRELAEQSGGDLPESQILELVRHCADESDEQPETVLKKLKDLRVIEPVEADPGFYVVAGPVVHVIRYLLYEAKAATSDSVLGHVNSLEDRCKRLNSALEAENVTEVELIVGDINQILRRIYDDVAATHASILAAIAEFKTGRRSISVREKFQRIVYWMEAFVLPMVDIIKVDGVMEEAFAETERLLRLASDQSVFNDLGAIERNLRFIRLVRKHALRVFDECRREIQPLYQALARSTNIAAGAALALERLRRDGAQHWGSEPLVPVFFFRQQYAVTDSAIKSVLERIIHQPPELPPVVNFNEGTQEPAGMRQRRWLDSLPDRVAAELPIEDLLGWLTKNYGESSTSEILAGFSTLVFHERFRSQFANGPIRDYETPDHVLRARPVHVEPAEK